MSRANQEHAVLSEYIGDILHARDLFTTLLTWINFNPSMDK